MFKRTIFTLVSIFAAGAILAQAYKWTDEDGIVHYSDRPQEGAEEIRLPSDRGRRQPAPVSMPGQPSVGAGESAREAEPFRYQNLSIVSPVAEETLWNIGGVLSVTLNFRPNIQPGHRLQVYLDGMPRTVNTATFSLDEVHRGSHILQAEIIDQSGVTVTRSTATKFYVQQTSVNGPR